MDLSEINKSLKKNHFILHEFDILLEILQQIYL